MWQRFTERARRMVFFAQEEAEQLGTNQVATEHLLLGLLREEDHVAAQVLKRMDLDLQTIRDEVHRRVKPGESKPGADKQLTPRAKRVIDLSYDEARQLSNNYIGTEHVLLGLIRESEGPASNVLQQLALEGEDEGLAGRVLRGLGVDLATTRAEIRKIQEDTVQKGDTLRRILLPDTTLIPKAKALAKRAIGEVYDDFSVPEEDDAGSTPKKGDIGTLGNDDGRKSVEFVPDAGYLNAFAEVISLKDEFAYRDLVSEGKVLLVAAGTGAKFLRKERSDMFCVRILDGDHAGKIGFVLPQQLKDLRKDDRPFPPEIV